MRQPVAPNATDLTDSHWILWGASAEIRPGQVVPTTVGGRDLVVWRERTGALRCLDGVCRHLGANLGYGGEVLGDRLQCPFHGWTYDGNGVNVEQPGIKVDPAARSNVCLASYGVVEAHGLVFLSSGRHADSPQAQAFHASLCDLVGDGEVGDGEVVAGAPLRWALTLPTVEGAVREPSSGEWSWSKSWAIFEWLLSRQAGERVLTTSDPRWMPIQPSARAEACAGPLSAVNGTHTAAPVVRFLQVVTNPVLEGCTIGGGVQLARIHALPAALKNNKPYRRHERIVQRVLGASRLIGSVTQLTDQTLGLTFVGVYPRRRSTSWTIPVADAMLRHAIGGRLEHLATAVDVARFAGRVPSLNGLNAIDGEWPRFRQRQPSA